MPTLHSYLLAAILAVSIVAPSQCVSRERIETCESACAVHGGYSWVVADGAADYDCVCADWTLIEFEESDADAT